MNFDYWYIKNFYNKKEKNKICIFIEKNFNHLETEENKAKDIDGRQKKKTNTLYTINALNEAIKLNNNGILDKSFQLNWEVYSDCILLVNDAGLKKINTAVKEIIRIKTK